MTLVRTILCWKWKGWRGSSYGVQHVVRLKRMLDEHVSVPFRLVCITDNPKGIPDDIETLPIWKPPFPYSNNGPNCYLRMKAFDMPELGECVTSIDLDCTIQANIDDLLEPPDTGMKIALGYSCPYNGSLWTISTSQHRDVWTDLNADSADKARSQRLPRNGALVVGSDQTWLAYKKPGMPTWGADDGICQYTMHSKDQCDNARIIFYAGRVKPWMARRS